MRIFLISDNVDTRTGLRLAGVDGAVAHTRDEFKAQLDRAVADKDVAIVAVSELLGRQFPDLLAQVRETRLKPLVVEIPDRHGTARAPDFLSRYVREAIGVKL